MARRPIYRTNHDMAYRDYTLTPKDGGKLAPSISGSKVDLANYRIKRDFRRYLDRERRREGHDWFRSDEAQSLSAGEPINLIYTARSANGKTAVFAGTPTRLFRYFGEAYKYVSDVPYYRYFKRTGPWTPYPTPDGPDTPYVHEDDVPVPYWSDYTKDDVGWEQIGGGFTATANRWQAVTIGDDIVFNNGIDLPVSYSLGATEVTPMYEMRENGIAAVGTIAAYNSVLLAGDIIQIKDDPTTMAAVFDNIVQLGTAAQQGALFSGFTHGTQQTGSDIVDISGGAFVFDSTMIGKMFRFRNGFLATITAINSPTQAVLDTVPVWQEEGQILPFTTMVTYGDPIIYDGNIDLPFDILNTDNSDYIVNADNPVFDVSMVGMHIYWDSGEVRQILTVVDQYNVTVESDYSVPRGTFSTENPKAYGTITDTTLTDERVYRIGNSALGLARRWSAEIPCSITAGSKQLHLEFPARSFYDGQEVVVVGAGLNGGNLVTSIVYINGATWTLADKALTTVYAVPPDPTTQVASTVQARDMLNSIVSFDDLDGDGSRILRMLQLNTALVIYRETGYHTGIYNPQFNTDGTIISPFQFGPIVRTANTLYYRNTLINVTMSGYNFHLFAGSTNFYRLDLVSPQPVEYEAGQLVAKVFFDQVKAETFTVGSATYRMDDYTYAADNELTKEIFIVFPSATSDKALCFDYVWGTFSSTSAAYSASGTVWSPISEKDTWFVAGTMTGSVLMYGLTSKVWEPWQSLFPNTGLEMFNRLGQGYESEQFSGQGMFSRAIDEKTINIYVLELSTFSPDTPAYIELYKAENQNSTETMFASMTFDDLANTNVFPVYDVGYYLADRILVVGKDNPFEILQRTYNVDVLKTTGVTKAA